MKLRSFMMRDFQIAPGSIKIPIGDTIDKYHDRYEALKKREKFSMQVYTVSPGGRQIAHVKVPSETVHGFHYDVLIEFEQGKSATDWDECDIKVFSNCPSFVFGYAYVFSHWHPEGRPANERDRMMVDSMKLRTPKESMFIDGLAQKIGPQPTHQQPVIRNPMGIPMLDKSLYMAVFFIKESITLQDFFKIHNNVSIKAVAVTIPRYESLMNERKRLLNRQKEMAARDKKTTVKVVRATEREIAKRGMGVQQPIHAKSTVKPKTVTASAAKVKSTSKVQSPKSTRAKSK